MAALFIAHGLFLSTRASVFSLSIGPDNLSTSAAVIGDVRKWTAFNNLVDSAKRALHNALMLCSTAGMIAFYKEMFKDSYCLAQRSEENRLGMISS